MNRTPASGDSRKHLLRTRRQPLHPQKPTSGPLPRCSDASRVAAFAGGLVLYARCEVVASGRALARRTPPGKMRLSGPPPSAIALDALSARYCLLAFVGPGPQAG